MKYDPYLDPDLLKLLPLAEYIDREMQLKGYDDWTLGPVMKQKGQMKCFHISYKIEGEGKIREAWIIDDLRTSAKDRFEKLMRDNQIKFNIRNIRVQDYRILIQSGL